MTQETQSVMTKEAREIEMEKRRAVVNSTIASFALEDVSATPAALALAERYINLEIDSQQLVELAGKL